MTTKPISQVLLKIDNALQDELVTDSGLKFYIDPSFKKEWQASVTATVAALPVNPHPKHKYILDQLNIGDEICMAYRVVADFSFKGDSAQFMQVTEDNPHLKEFVNGLGYWVKMYALPKRSGLIGHVWVGVYTNNRMEIIDGVQGTEEELYRWMAQFPFGKTDLYTFNNLFQYEGQDYWKADLDDIFAKKVKGHLVAVGDRVICRPIDEDVPDQFLIDAHKGHKVKIRHTDRGKVLSGGKAKGIKKDETISFDPKFCEKYTFWNKEYYLIKEDFILGKWN